MSEAGRDEDALAVRWSAARQVGEELGWHERRLPAPDIGVGDYFRDLRGRSEVETAVTFLAAALPRHESIAWAAHVLDRAAKSVPALPPRDRDALDRALAWVASPAETERRAAQDAGDAADEDAPERMLAAAVFLSGGSISMPGLPPVAPPAGVSGKLAAAGIILAAHRSADPAAAFAHALDLGEAVAMRGLAALPSIAAGTR